MVYFGHKFEESFNLGKTKIFDWSLNLQPYEIEKLIEILENQHERHSDYIIKDFKRNNCLDEYSNPPFKYSSYNTYEQESLDSNVFVDLPFKFSPSHKLSHIS